MSSTQLTSPAGSTKEFPKGTTAREVAQSVSPSLAAEALAAKADGRLMDLPHRLESSGPIQIITPSMPEGLEIYRHSCAHLLAAAVLELFPDAHPGVGPPTDTGFYYDFYREKPFTEEDLQKLEAKRSEEHTSELQSPCNLVCRLLLEKKKPPRKISLSLRCLAA